VWIPPDRRDAVWTGASRRLCVWAPLAWRAKPFATPLGTLTHLYITRPARRPISESEPRPPPLAHGYSWQTDFTTLGNCVASGLDVFVRSATPRTRGDIVGPRGAREPGLPPFDLSHMELPRARNDRGTQSITWPSSRLTCHAGGATCNAERHYGVP